MSNYEQFERSANELVFWFCVCCGTFTIVALSVVGLILYSDMKSEEYERLRRFARMQGDFREPGYTRPEPEVDPMFDFELDADRVQNQRTRLEPGRLTT